MGAPYDSTFMIGNSHNSYSDRGGKTSLARNFTSACGQTVFRGHALPWEDNGRYFVCDPTIQLVRRATIEKRGGLNHFSKVEPGTDEFLNSSDINSRFVNTATGPDGCLYVTDMYRGIIQDAPWLSAGPRKAIVEAGLDKNIQMGRIWRIRHKDHTPTKKPKMLDMKTNELLHFLESDNGWTRDTAQKLILLRKDRDEARPHLVSLSKFSKNPLTRLHALRTLEGMDYLTRNMVDPFLQDRDSSVQQAAIQILERWIDQEDVIKALETIATNSNEVVAQQLIFTLGMCHSSARPQAEKLIQQVARRHSSSRGVILATSISLWGRKELPLIKEINSNKFGKPQDRVLWKTALVNWNRGIKYHEGISAEHRRQVRDGEQIYFKSCVSCHGADGAGAGVANTDLMMAPPLKGSQRVMGHPEHLIPILLHGLTGTLDGKTYQGHYMAPAATLGIKKDQELAKVISFIRYAWGNNKSHVTTEDIDQQKKVHKDRKKAWTQEELEKIKIEGR